MLFGKPTIVAYTPQLTVHSNLCSFACYLSFSSSSHLGWDKWPQVKEYIKPVVADDGLFYVTPKEFFDMFGTIFVSASDMTEFLED